MPARYPVVLDVTGALVVVAGGGRVATRRVLDLLDAGAYVRVVAPEVTAELAERAAAGAPSWLRRPWQEGDLAGAALALAATGSPATNRAVAAQARAAGVPVNVADQPGEGTFQVPAVLRRGDLLVAVATTGRVPGLAGALRRRLGDQLGPEWAALVELLAGLRGRLPAAADADGWDRLLAPGLLEAVRAGDLVGARTLAERRATARSR
ncbi:MAG TPA: bifunctional precorrin-2 dehydrogenase/sirohydrochlorin ferrochelatase [Actinomycetes bacterium]|nr:bifunctional precorrin-2 dehydrogenase/sirohydrochlorin ferrochelatase [Actinomycetes bacterium]